MTLDEELLAYCDLQLLLSKKEDNNTPARAERMIKDIKDIFKKHSKKDL